MGEARVRELREGDIHPFLGLDMPTLLERRATTTPEAPFLVWQPPEGEARLDTYAGFRDRVAALAGGLAALGVSTGDRVVIHLENCPEFLESWHACARLGAIAVTTNTRSVAAEFAYFVQHSGARVVITQPSLIGVVRSVEPRPRAILCLAHDPAEGGPRTRGDWLAYEECLDPARAPALRPADPLAHAGVIYTSGTTSKPKGVVWSHANALWSGAVGASHLGLRADDVGLAFMPLFHTNALAYSTFSTLWAGASIVLMHKFSASRFWPIAIERRCTWASMIPFGNKALLSQPGPEAPHSFRLWGNAFVEPQVEPRWGIPMIGWWGMTETITQGIVGHRHLRNTPGAMGYAAPEYEVSITDSGGAPVAPGGVGRLRIRGIRGLSLFREYLNDPAATAAAFDEDGWFMTGDLVRLLPSGEVQFVDREKDMLKVGGENVAASEVERVILGVAGVGEVAVVSRAHEMLDEVPVACVIAAVATPDLGARILEACRNQLARYKVPAEVLFMDEFPRAALNKIDKRSLREAIRRGGARH